MTGNADPAASAPKPKVVIGRLYEKPTPEREKPAPRAEEVRQEARPAPEIKAPQTPIPSAPDRMAGAVETPCGKATVVRRTSLRKTGAVGRGRATGGKVFHGSRIPGNIIRAQVYFPMMGRPATEIPRNDHTVSPGKFSNYIIIVYTAIMLILGYIVYRDVSKRVSRVESRILAIEKKLNP